MTLNRRTALGLAALAVAPATATARTPTSDPVAPPDPDETIRLWPDGAPGGDAVSVTPRVVERSTNPAFHDRFAQYTTDPFLTVLRPARPNGASLLLIPGPLQDAQRALRLVRSRATADGLDPTRVAVLGASAGGHLAGLLTARPDATYAPVDAADAVPFRPDLSILMYPVATMADPFVHAGSRAELLGPAPTAATIDAYSLERIDWTGAPPTFLLHALDDGAVPVENSLALLSALRAHSVPAEAHLFEEGGHGFGIRLIAGRPAAVWPELVLAWAARHGWTTWA